MHPAASPGRRGARVQRRGRGPGRAVRPVRCGRFDGDLVNALGVANSAHRSTDELLALVSGHLQPRGLPALFGGRIALTDGLLHHQHIRRALRLPRHVPADRLCTALRFAPLAPPIRARRRIRGLMLTATDLDWRPGRGPAVEGPGEALLMGARRTCCRAPGAVRPRHTDPRRAHSGRRVDRAVDAGFATFRHVTLDGPVNHLRVSPAEPSPACSHHAGSASGPAPVGRPAR
jgi:hypothetical protein